MGNLNDNSKRASENSFHGKQQPRLLNSELHGDVPAPLICHFLGVNVTGNKRQLQYLHALGPLCKKLATIQIMLNVVAFNSKQIPAKRAGRLGGGSRCTCTQFTPPPPQPIPLSDWRSWKQSPVSFMEMLNSCCHISVLTMLAE